MIASQDTIDIPWPLKSRRKIWPIFMPYLGCPRRCVFCAQEAQTGQATATEHALKRLLTQCLDKLEQNRHGAPQLAFYGGTFTALTEPLWQMCLEFAARARARGLISGFRCSTRPDRIRQKRLGELVDAGCNLIELGIQSFQDDALAAAERGYNGATARAACAMARANGLGPGIQLMPGMPGGTGAGFLADARESIAQGAACLRFYPCLVLRGSALAQRWRAGKYRPWRLEKTIASLSHAWLVAAKADIPVIRMGLAPEAELKSAILAGPVHAALGGRVMARALLLAARERIGVPRPFRMIAPPRMQGLLWGWRRELAAKWHALGLAETSFSGANGKIRLEML